MYKVYWRVEKKGGKWEGEKKGKEEGRGGSERERKRVNLFYEAHIALIKTWQRYEKPKATTKQHQVTDQ